MSRRRDDFDDVPVAEAGAERHHLPVHPRADTLVPDIGVNGIGEIHWRSVAWKRFDLPLRREDVDLLRVEIDLQVLQELLGIANLLLPFEELPQPDEILFVATGADTPFLVLPVRGDPLFSRPVHLHRSDLHLEGKATLADHGRVKRLVAVGPRRRDEILDASGHR